jgi:hypothetical protein
MTTGADPPRRCKQTKSRADARPKTISEDQSTTLQENLQEASDEQRSRRRTRDTGGQLLPIGALLARLPEVRTARRRRDDLSFDIVARRSGPAAVRLVAGGVR